MQLLILNNHAQSGLAATQPNNAKLDKPVAVLGVTLDSPAQNISARSPLPMHKTMIVRTHRHRA